MSNFLRLAYKEEKVIFAKYQTCRHNKLAKSKQARILIGIIK